MKTIPTIKKPDETKRVFIIKRQNNFIDVEKSYLLVNNQVSRELFKSEIYKVSFSTVINSNIKTYDLFLTANELISNKDIAVLKEIIGVEIIGDGSGFEVVDFKRDFSIQFDQENSSFINSKGCLNGFLSFKKGKAENYLCFHSPKIYVT